MYVDNRRLALTLAETVQTFHHRRFVWLDLVERGTPVATLARRHHLAIPVVQAAIDAARAQLAAHVEALRLLTPPPLYLFFPIPGLFPGSTCNHDRVPLPDGSLGCCAVCSRSGRDDHPCLDRFPSLEPAPEPEPPATEPEPLTRKQKRALKHVHASRIPA